MKEQVTTPLFLYDLRVLTRARNQRRGGLTIYITYVVADGFLLISSISAVNIFMLLTCISQFNKNALFVLLSISALFDLVRGKAFFKNILLIQSD